LRNLPFLGGDTVLKKREKPSFFVVKCDQEGQSLAKTCPIKLHRQIKEKFGEPQDVRKLGDGTLLIEAVDDAQAEKIMLADSLLDLQVKPEAHRTLNSSKGIVTCDDLKNSTVPDILDELKGQGVTHVEQMKFRAKGTNELTQSANFILTFNSVTLPSSVKVAMYRLRVRHFIPNPRRCFKCHKYGHIGNNCKSQEACGLCAGAKHDGNCSGENKCVNCGAKHPAWSKQCPVYKREFGIQEIITKERLPYREAKRKYIELLPPMLRTFADVAGGPSKKTFVDKSIEKNLEELRQQATPDQHRRNSWTSGDQASRSDPRSGKRQRNAQASPNASGVTKKQKNRSKKSSTQNLEGVVRQFDGPPKKRDVVDTDSGSESDTPMSEEEPSQASQSSATQPTEPTTQSGQQTLAGSTQEVLVGSLPLPQSQPQTKTQRAKITAPSNIDPNSALRLGAAGTASKTSSPTTITGGGKSKAL
jgi:hypothetical protein